jgi:uncharacterized Zn finger protein
MARVSKPTGLDALLTEARLRKLAGPVYFQRGADYLAHGAVSSLQMNGERLAASVQGSRRYSVRLWAEGRSLDWSCTCPLGEEGELCKHVVAAGLAWLRNGEQKRRAPRADAEPAALDAFLRGLDHDALVRLILERAGDDESFATRLLVKAQSEGLRRPKAVLRAIEQALEVDGYVGYREAPAYVSRAQQAVDLLEATLAGGDFGAALDLSEHALRLGFSAFEQVDDSGGAFGEVVGQIAEVHRRACAGRVLPGPQLADRLFALLMEDQWGIVDVTAYRRALGRDGLERFREVVRRAWDKLPALGPDSRSRAGEPGRRYLLMQLMKQVVASGADVDAQVDIERRDLSYPGAFLRIAELLKKARRRDEALAWAERGAQIFPGGPRDALREWLAAEYQRRKQFDRALALRWEDFQKYPGLETYRSLERCARAAAAWAQWRGRALDLLRSNAALSQPRKPWGTDASALLTEIHLAEGDRTSALVQARAGGCTQALWLRLAAACEDDAPGDAVAIYLGQLDHIIDGRDNHAYDQAAQLLRKIGRLMRRQGQATRFLDVLAGVQTRHKPKRNLMKRLERVAAEARKQGPGR